MLQVLHFPEKTPSEIDVPIFEMAVDEVEYFASVAKQCRPPQSAADLELNPTDDVSSVALRGALTALRGTHFKGVDARSLLALSRCPQPMACE